MKKTGFHIIFFSTVLFLFFSCSKADDTQATDVLPPIYPDYTNITIPYNIAPLNFILRNKPSQTQVILKGQSGSITFTGSDKIQFSEKRWKKFIHSEQGNTVTVQVRAKISGQWIKYKTFNWSIVTDKIDPYLSYRLSEPAYDISNKIQLCGRHLESFDVKIYADNHLINNAKLDYLTYGYQNPNLTFFSIDGEKGGIILNRDGLLKKIKIENKNILPEYGNFHPSGKYGVFPINKEAVALHTLSENRFETYNTSSSIVVIDFDKEQIISSSFSNSGDHIETYPVFSADGNEIYYCAASLFSLPDSLKYQKYHLCKIYFDSQKGGFTNKIDTLINSSLENKSIALPKPSPNGLYLLYNTLEYETSPPSYQKTKIQLLNLRTMEADSLSVVNQEVPNTYHSWSSNSHWFVFSSKRDDGIYERLYFCYIDNKGKVYKPFILPQRNPYYYDYSLKSFAYPELSSSKLSFNSTDIEHLYWEAKIEEFK